MRRSAVRLCASVLTAGLLLGCQPAGGPPGGGAPTEARDGSDPVLGAPAAGLPRTLAELLGRTDPIAREWQDEPVLAEIEVDLDEEGAWQAARVVYLAADADRFFALVTTGNGFSQQRPTLATLQLQPVTADGMAALPPLPDAAAEPRDLAEGPAAEECDIPHPRTVLYVTGAPVAWDGTAWTRPPEWTATVTSGDAAAAVDVVSGEVRRCLD